MLLQTLAPIHLTVAQKMDTSAEKPSERAMARLPESYPVMQDDVTRTWGFSKKSHVPAAAQGLKCRTPRGRI